MQRPWNRVTTPVYSLITFDASDHWNANICTYVSGVSIAPKHLLVALAPASKTHANFKASGTGWLQVLSEDNLSEVTLLGKKSGHKTDKFMGLEPVLQDTKSGVKVLPGILGYISVKLVESLGFGQGDHELFVVLIEQSVNLNEGKGLHLQHLIEAGLILRPRS